MTRRAKAWFGWSAGLLALTASVGLLALRPDCEPAASSAPTPVVHVEGGGALQAGGASVPFALPIRVSRAGFPSPQPLATPGEEELAPGARALLLEAGTAKLALVSLDLLLIPEPLRDAIRERLPKSLEVAVVATHTHSGPGGFDARTLAGLAGTGWPQEAVASSIVDAAVRAVLLADARRAPARLEWATHASVPGLNRTRSEGAEASQRLSVLRLVSGKDVHALVLTAAHPTLAGRHGEVLDVDYPGRVRLHEGDGVTLVLQGAGGNASVPASGPDGPQRAADHAERVARAVHGMLEADAAGPIAHADVRAAGAKAEAPPGTDVHALPSASQVALGATRIEVPTPAPDAERLVPWAVRGVTERALCSMAPTRMELSLWQLGSVRLLLVPAEVTGALESRLLTAAKADALVSLANGYIGYVEEGALVHRGVGESHRQLFVPTMSQTLEQAAKLAGAR